MPKEGYKQTKEHRNKIGRARKGIIFSEETKRKMSAWQEGRTLPKETKDKISASLIGKTGEKNRNWKGGFKFAHDKGYANHRISFEHPNCVWHHVNMMFVVACPEEIHNHTLHHVLGSAGIHAHFLEGVLG